MFASVHQVMCQPVAELELLFHKILEIRNLVNNVTGNKSMGYLEKSIEHSLRGSKGVEFLKNIV